VDRSVFADARALLFKHAVCCGHPQGFLRPAPLDVIHCKEARDVSAADLFKRVARHFLRAGIPTSNLALRAQHNNRVVLDSLNETAIFVIAVAKRRLGDSASNVIALDIPTCGGGDQQAQKYAQDHNGLG
jgi:hypothetical protein